MEKQTVIYATPSMSGYSKETTLDEIPTNATHIQVNTVLDPILNFEKLVKLEYLFLHSPNCKTLIFNS